MRALNYLASQVWAIEPEMLERMRQIASREYSDIEAVERERGVPLENTRKTEVREGGVAIIPITGPIFRYANIFVNYCGGTATSLLARDFHQCLENPNVKSIIFEINSPGGEATGISEFAEMVYQARGRKPLTARVGGHGCSAAYWIASACDEIVCADTAVLGSIGCCVTLLDTTEADKKLGYKEKTLRSNVSPNKCLDPTTTEGEKQLQATIDVIGEVFVAAVARNRGISPEKVISDYGAGAVSVGAGAVTAGLADRLANLEDVIAELSGGTRGVTLNPNASDDSDPEYIEPDNESLNTNAAPTDAVLDSESKGTSSLMGEITNPTAAITETATTALLAELQTKLAAETQARTKAEELLSTVQTDATQANKRVAKLEADARRTRLTALATNFTGDRAAKTTLMEQLADKFGEDSEQMKAYVADQNATAAQLRESGLFKEVGASGETAENATAEAKLDAEAKRIAKADGISYEAAYDRAMTENPSLYTAYLQGK